MAMTTSAPSSQPLAAQKLSISERLVLEMVSLNYWVENRRELTESLVKYARFLKAPDSVGHLDRTLESLARRGLIERDGSMFCSLAGEDLVAEARLAGRLPFFLISRAAAPKRQRMESSRIAKCKLRMALYTENFDECERLLSLHPGFFQELAQGFFSAWAFGALPSFIRREIISEQLNGGVYAFSDPGVALPYLEQQSAAGLELEPLQILWLGEQWIARGNMSAARKLAAANPELPLQGWLDFQDGSYAAAQSNFSQHLATLKKINRRACPLWSELPSFMYFALLLRARQWNQAAAYLKSDDDLGPLRAWFEWTLAARSGARGAVPTDWHCLEGTCALLFVGYCAHWQGQHELLSALRPALTKLAEVARQLGYSWVDFEVNALLEGAPGVSALLDCLSSHEQWRHTLLALLEARESPVGTQSERVVWHLREASGSWSILPKLQKLDKKGNWSAGRCIDYGSGYPACANPAEEKAIALVRRGDGLDALALLVGHPLVFFFDAPSEPVAVVAGRPVLTIKRVDDHLHLSLAPYPAGGNAVVREGPRRIVFYVFDQPQRNVASLLGPSGLLVPASESAMVEQVATNLSSSFEVLTDFAVSAKQQLLEELTRSLGGSSLELVL